MQIEINGKRNITLDFNAPKKFRLTQNGAEIPYIRTGKNSFRLSKNIDGSVEMEEVKEKPRYMKSFNLQAPQMTFISSEDVSRLNEAVRQMSLVNPEDVMAINNAAEKIDSSQMYLSEKQQQIEAAQSYIDQQQQRLNESALNIQALETNNSQRLDNAETAIYSLAGEVENTKSAIIDGLNATFGKIDQQGAILQAEIDTKADKEELESLKKDIEEKSDQFSNAMASYSGGYAYDTLPRGGEAGQILAKRTDRQGDYVWIDQTPVIVKSETIPTASEKYKGEVYQYVGETGEYTHGYIYECQKVGNTYQWVRLDVQPNTAVWGQITGTLSDQTDLQEALDNKQDKLTQTQMDAVNSGANQSNIAQITTNKTNINTINSKIPAQASSSNQLADKDFVNSSIATNTANFIGTFNSVAEMEAYSGTLTNNDYAFVVRTDAQGNTVYDRYKYTDATTPSSWVFEYELNNSSFTAAQWNAINSGATTELVNQITTNQGNITTIQTEISGKQDTLVSGTNIKTINNNSILGSGNLNVDGLPSQSGQSGKFLTTNGTTASWAEIQLSNPFFFGMHIWSDTAITNASWLISNSSYHSGATYVDFYQWLLKIKNGTLTVDGVSVKAYGASDITDYDYVINTADTTFRLPVKVKLASGNAVVGNGMTLGLTDGTDNFGLVSLGQQWSASYQKSQYGSTVGTSINTGEAFISNKTVGVTTDPTKSGIETSSSGLKLYFYVGETIQDANVIAASQVLTDVANLKAHSIVETYVNGTSWYRVYSDGWCEQGGNASSAGAITLLKSFKDTNYIITVSLLANVNQDYTSKTTTGFRIGASGSWQASGYIT